MAHRLGSKGNWTEIRNTCRKRGRQGRRQGRGIERDGKWRLVPSIIYHDYLRCWGMKEDGTEPNSMGTN